ncbi:MAG: hypothetical protein Q8P52_00560 [bacterium]|nr:hypothetical protein [bacterium]
MRVLYRLIRKTREKLSSKILRFAALVFIALMIPAVNGVFHKERNSMANLNEARTELASLEKRKEGLSQSIENLSSESGFDIEIRKKFPLAKEGEHAIIFIEGKDRKQSDIDEISDADTANWFSKWFGGWFK